MNYQQSLKYIYSLSESGIKLGLENTSRLLSHFDQPQLKVRAIHIAGTNGKGSTAAFMESILRTAGYKTGLYTSPHLLDFRERIQINRKLIQKEALCDLVARVKAASDKLGLIPTFFEFGTVMAFIYFYEQGTDWNIIETGLGGRLDATNLCQGEISIITSISRDHIQYLGEDLTQIASEKAEIIKNNGAVITAVKDENVFEIIRVKSLKMNVPVYRLGMDFCPEIKNVNEKTIKFDYRGQAKHIKGIESPLPGEHQAENASLAITAGLLLNARDCKISESAIKRGIKTACWAGRIELVQYKPKIVLDCAHNPESVKVLADVIRRYFTYKRCFVVLGVMRDKEIDKIIEIIDSFADHIILVRPRQERSADPELLLKKLSKSQKVVEIIEEIQYALCTISDISNPDDIICVTGSIYTVAEARQSIENQGIN